MKKQLLFSLALLFLSLNAFPAHYYLFNISDAYSQAVLQVNLGDTVTFATSSNHTTQQVTQATWLANDSTLMPGGLDGPPGGFTFVATTLGDMYFVCVEHIQSDMMKCMVKVSQLGIEANKAMTFQILQSVSEQYVELVVKGGSVCEMHVEMLNLSGQIVRKLNMELTGDETIAFIETNDLPKGVYMIRWTYGSVNKARKIILQ
jgi:hypothetical protein